MTTERVMVSSTDSRAGPAAFLFPPNRVASWSISCALFTVFASGNYLAGLLSARQRTIGRYHRTHNQHATESTLCRNTKRLRCPQTRLTVTHRNRISTGDDGAKTLCQ